MRLHTKLYRFMRPGPGFCGFDLNMQSMVLVVSRASNCNRQYSRIFRIATTEWYLRHAFIKKGGLS